MAQADGTPPRLFGGDRRELRSFLAGAWRKRREGLPLEPLEAQLADVVAEHPEYWGWLETPDGLDQDFDAATDGANPFLHLALHQGVREQLATDRPAGVARAFRDLLRRSADGHAAEHALMGCLADAIWRVTREGRPFDEQAYLECIRRSP